jgi:glutamate racemase
VSPGESVIGMLDWGVGGLGCYRALRVAYPNLNVLYCSDTGAAPYGKLTQCALSKRVAHMLARLVTLGATHLIVACNAASTVLADVSLPVPLLGIVECGIAVVPAAFSGSLGLVGGLRTIESQLYQRALSKPTRRIVARVAQPLSAHIEAGSTDSPAFAADLAEIMAPLADAEAILLACTHYPAVAAQIAGYAPRAELLDPAAALTALISTRWQLATFKPSTRLFCTGDPDAMQYAARRVWGVDAGSVTFLRA